jgi:hypothetical protein
MAEKARDKRESLTEDPLVATLIPDPAKGPPNTILLRGYLGRGSAARVWRLYLTASLDEYAEIQEDDILHRVAFPDDQGTAIWVRRTAPIQYVRVQMQEVPADLVSEAWAVPRPWSTQRRVMSGRAERRAPIGSIAVPFALATPHHAGPIVGPGALYPEGKNWVAKYSDYKRKYVDDPGGLPFFTEAVEGDDDLLRRQYEQLLDEYTSLIAAYRTLRPPTG